MQGARRTETENGEYTQGWALSDWLSAALADTDADLCKCSEQPFVHPRQWRGDGMGQEHHRSCSFEAYRVTEHRSSVCVPSTASQPCRMRDPDYLFQRASRPVAYRDDGRIAAPPVRK